MTDKWENITTDMVPLVENVGNFSIIFSNLTQHEIGLAVCFLFDQDLLSDQEKENAYNIVHKKILNINREQLL